MDSVQSLALGQAAALIASSVQDLVAGDVPPVSHNGENSGNSRNAYGGPQYNFDFHPSPQPKSNDPERNETRYHVTHNVCSHFTGRVKELKEIDAAFSSPTPEYGARRFVVFGMGGSGKTELCLRFAEKCRKTFWAVYFVDASSTLAADTSFASIAQKAGRKPTRKEGMDWLTNVPKRWLLIIDNADDPEVDVNQYCPPSRTGCILITTRNKHWRKLANVGNCEIERMPLKDAITLLLKVSEKSPTDPECRSQAQPIVEELDRLALALHQAGAVISDGHYRLDNYLDIYAQMFANMKTPRNSQNEHHDRSSIYATWEISRKIVEDMGTEQSAQACEILDIAALFHFQGIPEAVFSGSPRKVQKAVSIFEYFKTLVARTVSLGWKQLPGTKTLQASMGLQQFLGNLRDFPPTTGQQRDPISVHGALALLNRLSLISFDSDPSSFSMHRLVHQWSRERLLDRDRRWSRYAAVSGLVHAIPSQEHRDTEACNNRRRLLPHVSFFLSSASLHSSSLTRSNHEGTLIEHLDIHQSRVAAKLALVFVDNGEHARAKELYKESLRGFKKTMPEYSVDTLAVVDSLGVVYQKQNKYIKAEKMNLRAIEGRRKWLGEDHALTLESWSNLAVTLNSQGQHGRAEMLNREILKKREEILPLESPYTIDSVNNLALSLNHQAQYPEATELLTRAVDWRERNFGKMHLDTIESLTDLAATLHNQGSISLAIEKYQEALTRRLDVLGSAHPETLINKSDLALVILKSGDLEKAENLSREACEEIEAHIGVAKSYAPIATGTLAQVKFKQRNYLEAEQLFCKAIRGFIDDKLANTHPDLLRHRSLLAIVLRKQHKYNDAEKVYREVLDSHRQRPDQPNKDTMVCLTNLAVVLESHGNLEEAEKAHREALDGFNLLLPKNHPITLDCLENCARLLVKRREYSKAEKMYCRAVEGRKEQFGKRNATTLRSVAELAYVLYHQNRHHLAWALYQAACAGFEAEGVDNRHSQRCATRFADMKAEALPTEAPVLSDEENEWVRGILAPSDKQEAEFAAKEAIATNTGLKRGNTASPIPEPVERATKRLKQTIEAPVSENAEL